MYTTSEARRDYTPPRTVEQRMRALKIANDVRTKRATLKRDLKAGRVDPAGVILEPADWQESMRVFDLLLALPKWGRVKANRALRLLQISPGKTLGGLSRRQRIELAERAR